MADTKISAFADGTTPAGTDNFVVERSGGNNKLSWTELLAAMPGAEIGYDQVTTGVTVASTTEASGTTIISCAAHTFDGAAVIAEFFCPYAQPSINTFLIANLFEGATQIGRLGLVFTGAVGAQTGTPILCRYKFTPTAASHTYTVTAFKTAAGTGSAVLDAGVTGTGAEVPMFVRFTKV